MMYISLSPMRAANKPSLTWGVGCFITHLCLTNMLCNALKVGRSEKKTLNAIPFCSKPNKGRFKLPEVLQSTKAVKSFYMVEMEKFVNAILMAKKIIFRHPDKVSPQALAPLAVFLSKIAHNYFPLTPL